MPGRMLQGILFIKSFQTVPPGMPSGGHSDNPLETDLTAGLQMCEAFLIWWCWTQPLALGGNRGLQLPGCTTSAPPRPRARVSSGPLPKLQIPEDPAARLRPLGSPRPLWKRKCRPCSPLGNVPNTLPAPGPALPSARGCRPPAARSAAPSGSGGRVRREAAVLRASPG